MAVQQNEEYIKLLSHSIDIFLLYFDDEEKDVAFVAEECLNKTIKALLETNYGRILQVELCRFIKKNGPEKSFKAALIRFAELSHLIRPHRCRSIKIIYKILDFFLIKFILDILLNSY